MIELAIQILPYIAFAVVTFLWRRAKKKTTQVVSTHHCSYLGLDCGTGDKSLGEKIRGEWAKLRTERDSAVRKFERLEHDFHIVSQNRDDIKEELDNLYREREEGFRDRAHPTHGFVLFDESSW